MSLTSLTTGVGRRLVAVLASTGVVAAVVVAAPEAQAAPAAPAFDPDPTTLVNTSIGNNGDGTTFPGAALPFGMVQNSPDTRLKQYASYDYADTSTVGFSQIHLSGVGCQTTGLVRLMPTTGAVTSSNPTAYRSSFSHERESASPGRYEVTLDSSGIDAELSATERTGQHRYTYPAGQAQNVMVEVGEGNGYTFGADVKVVGDDTIEGHVRGGNFCWETGTERYDVFFSLRFDRPFTSFGAWGSTGAPVAGARERSTTTNNGRTGAYATFDNTTGRQVRASVGISYTSVEGARTNRVAESETDGALTSFDGLRTKAHDVWKTELERLRVAGGTVADRRTYYSALYRSLLHPSVGSDVDGSYMGFDKKVHTSSTPYYQMFSLWDTYRSQNQLVALLHPDRAADMASSLLRVYREGGWLPRWALGSGETNVMSGDPVTPFIVTLWKRGILDDATSRELFAALWRNANEVPEDQSIFRGRDGNPNYVEKGWIGYENRGGYQWGDTRQAGSATLEYAFGDCMLSQMAEGLGERDKAATLAGRCNNVEDMWDAAGTSKGFTGFPRPRTAGGAFAGSGDPTQSNAFHEGTAWQYQWLAQQDPNALFQLMGGRDRAEERLDTFFDLPKVLTSPKTVAKESWVIGAYDYHNNFAFNPNNEPDLHAPWMYAWTGAPWKTSAVMRAARPLFSDTAYGMPGNDDLGTISSWLVFSMIGVFEAQPGSGNVILSAPMFERVEISPEGGERIRINAPGASADRLQYISSVARGNAAKRTPWTKSWMSHADLLSAHTIDVSLTSDPARTTWGTREADRPPTFGPGLSRDFAASAASVTIVAGQSAEAPLTVSSFTDEPTTLTFATQDGPDGISVTPSSGTIEVAGYGRQTTPLQVSVDASVARGTYSVPIVVRAADGATAQVAVGVRVRTAGDLVGDIVEVTASNENTGSGEVAKNLTDDDPDTKWLAFARSGWAAYRLGEARTAVRYALTSANDTPSRDPRDFRLEGSNDGTTWTTLDTRTGITFDERFQLRTFDVADPGSYVHYRLNVTANSGDSLLQLADWTLLGAPS